MARRRVFGSGSERNVGAALDGVFKGYTTAYQMNRQDRADSLAAQKAQEDAAREQDTLKLRVFQAGQETAVYDPASGKMTSVPGLEGLYFDENNRLQRKEGAAPGSRSVRIAPSLAAGERGSVQQSQFVDSSDGTPLLFDRGARRYIRSDGGGAPKGIPAPVKGNQEAVAVASRGAEIMPKIDQLFDSLGSKSNTGARLATVPGISGVFYPEINQLRAEIKQVGFTFGGKNFTGNEEKIITDALIPGPLDNDASREAKRRALKGYVSGQIDLLDAANLLGHGGQSIRDIIARSGAETPAPGGPGGMVRVTNGAETREINLSDLAEAQRDGYRRVP